MLVDPWLVGELTFGGLSFIYAGLKRVPAVNPAAIAAAADFMLLTQACSSEICYSPRILVHELQGLDP